MRPPIRRVMRYHNWRTGTTHACIKVVATDALTTGLNAASLRACEKALLSDSDGETLHTTLMNMKRGNETRLESTRLDVACTYCTIYEEGAQDNHAQQNRAGRSHHL